eukprot:6531142-Alexandrium_andersonii.AAC.1
MNPTRRQVLEARELVRQMNQPVVLRAREVAPARLEAQRQEGADRLAQGVRRHAAKRHCRQEAQD